MIHAIYQDNTAYTSKVISIKLKKALKDFAKNSATLVSMPKHGNGANIKIGDRIEIKVSQRFINIHGHEMLMPFCMPFCIDVYLWSLFKIELDDTNQLLIINDALAIKYGY